MAGTWRTEPGPFEGDTGQPDPELAAALAAWAADETELRAATVHARLLAARLLVPVVARAAEVETSTATGLHADKTTEMMLPSVVGADGRAALPAFSGQGALARWSPAARPVPLRGADLLRQATDSGYAAVLLDPAGPVTFVVEGDALADLAAGYIPVAGATAGARTVAEMHVREPAVSADAAVDRAALRRAAEAAAAGVPGVAEVRLVEASEDGEAWELAVGVVPAGGAPPAYALLADRLSRELAPVLGDRPVLLVPLVPPARPG